MFLDLVLDYDCNLVCDYCTITLVMRVWLFLIGVVVWQLRVARDEGFGRVSFTGGELIIWCDLLLLVCEVWWFGYDDIKV